MTAVKTAQVPRLAEGFFFGIDQDKLQEAFDPTYPYTYCRICGWVYQPPAQRKLVPLKLQLHRAPYDSVKKRKARQVASARHSDLHTQVEKQAVGNESFTPEAQYRLAAFGIANMLDISLSKLGDKSNAQAGLEAPVPGFWLPDTTPTKVHK